MTLNDTIIYLTNELNKAGKRLEDLEAEHNSLREEVMQNIPCVIEELEAFPRALTCEETARLSRISDCIHRANQVLWFIDHYGWRIVFHLRELRRVTDELRKALDEERQG